MQRLSGVYRDVSGRPVGGALVSVFNAGTSTLASINQASGSQPAPAGMGNPFTTDATGFWAFAAPNGTYDIQISSSIAATQYIWNQTLSDATTTLLNPMTTQGDMIGGGVSAAPTRVAANTSATPMYVYEASGAVPVFKQIQGSEIANLLAPQIAFTQLGTGAIASTIDAKLKQNTYSPKDFGCAGDGVTDDTVNLQKAITAAANATLDLQGFPYKITAALTVSSPISILGRSSTVTQATAATPIFVVSSSNVAIRGVLVVGSQFAANQQLEIGFKIVGPSWASKISNVLIEDCSASNLGGMGVYSQYVTNLGVTGNSLFNINYAGVQMLSTQYFTVGRNYINNLIGSIGNSYGITASRATVDSLVTDPQSSDGAIVGNTIANNSAWEGLDTHGGLRITFSGNQVYNCLTGIGVVDAPGLSAGVDYAPKDIVVSGNTFASGKTDGSAHYGCAFTGATNAGVTIDWATGSIVGNVFEGFGDNTNQLGACIYMHSTSGVAVADNVISEPSPSGILLYHDNQGVTITGNTITDPWTNSSAGWKNGWGVYINGLTQNGYIGGNTYQRRLKSATTVFTRGIDVFNDASISFQLGPDSNGAPSLNVYDPGSRAVYTFWRPANHAAIAAPATPAAGFGAFYVDSTSKNMAVKNDAGVINHGVQTKSAVASNWITSIADDGSSVLAQPAFTDISGSLGATQFPALSGAVTASAGSTVTTLSANQSTQVTWSSQQAINFTDISNTGTLLGDSVTITVNPASTSSAQWFGFNSNVQSSASCAQTLTNGSGGLVGGAWTINHFGTALLTSGIAASFTANLRSGSGNATAMRGVQSVIQNLSANTLPTAISVNVLSATNSGGGGITTNYGVKIENQTVGATNYAMFTGTGLVHLGDALQTSGRQRAISTKTTTYTVTANDETILADATGAAFTISLPASPVAGEFHTFLKKDSSANLPTISGNGHNINGAATYTGLSVQYNKISVQYDSASTAWYIVG